MGKLTIRKMENRDIPAMLKMAACPEIQKVEVFENARKSGKSLSRVFNTLLDNNKEGVMLSYSVLEDEAVAGYVMRLILPNKQDEAIIGGWIAPAYRGRGLFTKSLSLLMDEIREEGVIRMKATAREDNLPSLRALENLGFQATEKAPDNKISYQIP